MHTQVIIQLLPNEEETYYFGFSGFTIESKYTLEKAQLGYSKHSDGNDITGSNKGDWLNTWCVVGSDTVVGDPFFINIETKNLPVFTAMHGIGNWEPELVSESFSGFLSSLKYLQNISKQEEGLIEPDKTTIIDESELSHILNTLLSLCGKQSKEFWECFIEQHQEWIEENEE